MTFPLVSILIVSYNHEKWVSKAIESVLSQTYQNIEVIVIDDYSKDRSVDVIRNFEGDPRVKVIYKSKNMGQSNSINQAVRLSKGKYLAWLASDDWYYPDKIQRQVALFETLSEKYGVVYGRTDRYYESDGRLQVGSNALHRGDVMAHLVTDWGFISPMSPMFRREVLVEYPMIERFIAEGESIFFKIAQKYYFDYVEDSVGVMRDHDYNTGSKFVIMYKETLDWWNSFLAQHDTHTFYRANKRRILGKLYRMYGLSILTETDRPKLARQLLIGAVRTDLRNLFDYKVLGGIMLSLLDLSLCRWIILQKRKKIVRVSGTHLES